MRKAPGSAHAAELVLLDHGLYMHLQERCGGDVFTEVCMCDMPVISHRHRRAVCSVWKSAVLHDLQQLDKSSQRLGINGKCSLVACSFVFFPPCYRLQNTFSLTFC